MTYKNITTILCFTIALAICNSCTGNKPLQARYQAEKMFSEANKSLETAQSFNKELTPEQQQDITSQFTKLVDYCYEQISQIDSNSYPVEFNEFHYITYQAGTRLSQLYYLKNEYLKCIDITNKLLTDINIPEAQKASVYINLGQCLQAGGEWDSAYTVYENIIERFSPPLTSSNEIITPIFNLPLYVFRVVNYIDQKKSISYEMTKTENYYLNLIHDFPKQKLETASRANLAKLYEETGQWKKELAQLELLTDPSSKSYSTVTLKKADLLASKLGKSDSALVLYNKIEANTPEDQEDIRAILMFKKALVQIDKKNYDLARSILFDIKKTYPAIYDQSPLFQYNLARSFELQDKWNRAEQEYNLLLEKFKGSSESMMTLLYLVDHFQKQKNTFEKDRWFKTADDYFTELAEDGRGTLLEARALLYQADLYNRTSDYQKSADALLSVFNKYPKTDPGKQALIKAIRLYHEQLNNPLKADSLLEQLKLTLANLPVSADSEDLLSK